MKVALLSATLPMMIRAAVKMPGGKQRLQAERDKLLAMVTEAEQASKPIPGYIRSALKQLNAAIGDAEVQA